MDTAELRGIGNRISERRRQLGYTQELLAEKMDVSIQMVSNLERGVKLIRADNLIKLCALLNVSTDYILLGTRTQADISDTADRLSRLSEQDYKMVEMLIDYCLNK